MKTYPVSTCAATRAGVLKMPMPTAAPTSIATPSTRDSGARLPPGAHTMAR
jgi:hypothetical protein